MHPKQLLFIFLLIANSCFIKAQTAPGIQWQRNIGTNYRDGVFAIQQTNDGGYITTGFDSSFLALPGFVARVVKLNLDGTTQWERSLRVDSFYTSAQSIVQTNDGGYIIGGIAGVTLPGGQALSDALIIKLNSAGDTVWTKRMGGSSNEAVYSARQTADDGYICAGYAKSTDGDVVGNHSSNYDVWVIKLDNAGTVEWKKCYGGSEWDEARCIRQTSDGGYIISGLTRSIDGDVTGYHGGNDVYDAWLLKINAAGVIEWQKCYGGTGWDEAWSVQQTMDGGYVATGNSESTNGDVTGNHGSFDIWVVKLNPLGNIEWQNCYGGSSYDVGYVVKQTSDSGYVVSGAASSLDGDVNGIHGVGFVLPDCWVIKLSATGVLQWQKCLGGTQSEAAFDICQTTDGGYFIGGSTSSTDGDVTVGYVPEDSWVVKLGPLPVPLTLTNFTARKQNKSILLNWQTQTETNTQHFILEKSSNQRDFQVVHLIAASGNSSTIKNYSFTDARPVNGINYYRLKQVDRDGSFVYSKTVSVNCSGKGSMLYPNPAAAFFTIVPAGTIKAITILTAEGKTVQQLPPVTNNRYDISRLPKGFYIVKLLFDHGEEVLPLHKN